VLDERWFENVATLVRELRQAGYLVEQGVEPQSMRQALKYANRKRFPYVVLIGEDEATQGTVSLKNMNTGNQQQYLRSDLLQALKR
jgi:histidyl-tRNA synthetase